MDVKKHGTHWPEWMHCHDIKLDESMVGMAQLYGCLICSFPFGHCAATTSPFPFKGYEIFTHNGIGYNSIMINSLHSRCIVKTSGFTRGVCKIGDSTKFKGFLVEFLENRRS